MDIGPGTDAELLQRALEGERVSDPGILELVAVLTAVTAVDQAALAPRAEFTSDLRSRLLSETAVIAAGAAGAGAIGGAAADADIVPMTPRPAAGRPDSDERDTKGGASVVRIAARPVRWLAASAAAVVLLGSAVGVASRSAVPGDALYPVKQVLDRAAVQLAGSPVDVGRTHLAQAQQHISEARDLIDRGSPDPADLDVALDAASASTTSARDVLLAVHRDEQRPDALTDLADFTAQARPQVDAMRPSLPEQSVPAWERLRSLLAQTEVDALRELASCTTCGERAAQARDALDGLAEGGVLPGGGVSVPGLPAPSVTVPGVPGPSGTGPPQPSVSPTLPPTTTPQVPGISVSLPGVTVTSVATVDLPTVDITSTGIGAGGGGVTLPPATVSLPSVGVTSSVVVGGGGITLPGVSIPLPTITIGL